MNRYETIPADLLEQLGDAFATGARLHLYERADLCRFARLAALADEISIELTQRRQRHTPEDR